jgi:hypothetical protein
MSDLLSIASILRYANLVAEKGVTTLVQPHGTPSGAELACRLNLHAHLGAQSDEAAVLLARTHRDFDVYHAPTALAVLDAVLPTLDGPTIFVLEAGVPTYQEEIERVAGAAGERPWFLFVEGAA